MTDIAFAQPEQLSGLLSNKTCLVPKKMEKLKLIKHLQVLWADPTIDCSRTRWAFRELFYPFTVTGHGCLHSIALSHNQNCCGSRTGSKVPLSIPIPTLTVRLVTFFVGYFCFLEIKYIWLSQFLIFSKKVREQNILVFQLLLRKFKNTKLTLLTLWRTI